jgi:hypothetical protein
MVHPALGWRLGLSWAPLLSRLRLPRTDVGVVSRLATVEAHSWKCWSLLPGRRSRHSLPRGWWSGWSRACRRRWKPLALSCVLLLLRTGRVLLLALLDLPLVLLLLLRVLVPRLGVAARRSRSHLPLLVLNLPALALGVLGSINQLVEVVEAVVHERVLQVVIESLPEAFLLIAIIGDLRGGVASELEETITVFGHRHSSLKMIIAGKEDGNLLSISYNKGGFELKKKLWKDFTRIYLLERKELLVLHLHHSSRNMVVPEMLPELDPSEGVAVPSRVGLPPVKSGASQLPCYV